MFHSFISCRGRSGSVEKRMVTWLELGHSFADALHHAGSLVAQNHRENALGVGAAQGVGVGVADSRGHDLKSKERHANHGNVSGLHTLDHIARAEGAKSDIVLTSARTKWSESR